MVPHKSCEINDIISHFPYISDGRRQNCIISDQYCQYQFSNLPFHIYIRKKSRFVPKGCDMVNYFGSQLRKFLPIRFAIGTNLFSKFIACCFHAGHRFFLSGGFSRQIAPRISPLATAHLIHSTQYPPSHIYTKEY